MIKKSMYLQYNNLAKVKCKTNNPILNIFLVNPTNKSANRCIHILKKTIGTMKVILYHIKFTIKQSVELGYIMQL